MTNLDSILSQRLAEREQLDQIRDRLSLESSQSSRIQIDNKQYINFSSNDYLGLANNASTQKLIQNQVEQLGVGSGASHLVCGHHKVHEQLEHKVATFLRRDSAITFSTGYMANLGILQSLAKKGDLIVTDKLNHASLIDGVKLSGADSLRYPHCDLKVLEKRLKKQAPQKWVVTDSVFSMDGDVAPLEQIAGICQKYGAFLIVDDAHGLGVIGESGRGCGEFFNLGQDQLPVLMGTFGKALGGFGAFVSGRKSLTQYLVQFARPYVYTTALPAIIAAANLHNLSLIENDSSFRNRFLENINYFKQLCGRKGIQLLPSETGIQPIMVKDTQTLMATNQRLKAAGFLVGAIRPPTVPKNTDRLRITLSASHKHSHIEQLVQYL